MSRSKKDRTFPHGNGLSSDAQLAKIIADALREDFGDSPSSIKRIGRLTGANLRAIKNWYIAKNAPSSRYLLILARMSPSILRFILMQVGGEDLWDVFDLFQRQMIKPKALTNDGNSVSKDTNLPEKTVTSRSPKERQAWFVEQVIEGHTVTAEDLMARWSVNLRTARRDISDLLHAGRVVFTGSRKSGRYELNASGDQKARHSLDNTSSQNVSMSAPRRRGRPRKAVLFGI
jgi:hypothetical protein